MEDLPELVQYFIDHHPHLTAQPIHELTSKFWRRLLEHDWPGNVRELFHILSYAISVSQNGILDERDFPSYFCVIPLLWNERKPDGKRWIRFLQQWEGPLPSKWTILNGTFCGIPIYPAGKRNKSSGGPRSYAAKFPVSYEEVPGNGKRG